ncbi:MAG: SpoIIE family protein phosphatase [Atopobiaceae bacterium]|nr:SpoIIE family protein phosphatase [Atopobiaceae bacterium]
MTAGRKHAILSWRGVLGDLAPLGRAEITLVLAAMCVCLTFTQNGLLHLYVGLGIESDAYVVLLLVPMMIAAFLLGIKMSAFMGAFAGITLALHAGFQPLGYYEVVAAWHPISVILFAVTGYVLGLLMAVALRNNLRGYRRRVRLVCVCLVISMGFSLTFFASIVIQISMWVFAPTSGDAAEAIFATVENQNVIGAVLRIGNPMLQMLLDFVLMSASALFTDVMYPRMWLPMDECRLQRTFRTRLFFVVSIGFMLVSAVSYAIVTARELRVEAERMQQEADYIAYQMESQRERSSIFDAASGQMTNELSEKERAELLFSFSIDAILEGYTPDVDGVVVIADGCEPDSTVLASDASDIPVVGSLGESFDSNVLYVIKKATRINAQQDQRPWIERVVYNKFNMGEGGLSILSQISYLFAERIDDYVVLIMRPTQMVFAERAGIASWIALSSLVMLSLVFAFVSILLKAVVVRPVQSVDEHLGAISAGELDTEVDVHGSSEMRSLSNSINTTVGTLKGWIAEAKRAGEQEMATAKAIQESALPSTFPPFPEIHAFDIYASMNAARDVGGDFYDFFLINDTTLGFLIADVSGKGIPGALFMMKAKAELDNYMQTGMDLVEAIKTVNYRLCDGNEAGMFVTVWAATLDFETGLLTYVNAGHNPPLLRHNGSWTWLSKKGGLFLGTFEMAKFRSFELTMTAGDELLLYTDGVNEAFNVDEEEYGNDRLEAFVAQHTIESPRELIDGLSESVASWAEGAEQSDDITMLALEFGKMPEVKGKLVVPALVENLERVVDFVDAVLQDRLCPLGIQSRINVAVEEFFVNVCTYAYADSDEVGDCTVEYVYTTNPNRITVCMSDAGVPFDPLALVHDTDRSMAFDAVQHGGLGIMLAARSVEDLVYVRDGDRNELAFSLSW